MSAIEPVMKLVVDLQGETLIEHSILPDGTAIVREIQVPTETYEPMTDAELAQRDIDAQAAAEVQATIDAAAVERAALVEKLAAGTATTTETQQALAALLG